jgi:phospholipid/cholesterol/gamma-HCH transport system permease protein
MASVTPAAPGLLAAVRGWIENVLGEVGDLTIFAGRVLYWTTRPPRRGSLMPVLYAIGVQSVPVVAVTGLFIGMVLAVQAYGQFASIGLETQLGQIINVSVVRELGPVLAATMLAGRVGGAMAAELATMRVTEQIDALSCLGANPIHHLAVPRFLACVLLIPLLTVVANFMGVLGGALISMQVYHIDSYHYWINSRGAVTMWDLSTGLIKPTFFGGAIAVISCHRGFNSGAGAQGVGQAATVAFVVSFVVILGLDFFIGLFLNNLHDALWPTGAARIGS